MLPPHDAEHLSDRAPDHSVTSEAGMICVVLPNFPLPQGFDRQSADLLLRLSPGYPVPLGFVSFDARVVDRGMNLLSGAAARFGLSEELRFELDPPAVESEGP